MLEETLHTYLSADIQNQLTEAMAHEVLIEISTQVIEAKLFSLLVDEISDAARKEQISFVLRYVDSDCNIQQRFIGWTTTERTYSRTIVQSIMLKLQ